jgi:hypothetical protein
MVIEHFIRYAGLAVGLMVVEQCIPGMPGWPWG